MNTEQALARIETLIFEITSDYEKGIAVGFIDACLLIRLITFTQHSQLRDRALAE